jgi:hypothetical protein
MHNLLMPKTVAPSTIYQLKITLLGVKPLIWRRVAVPGAWALSKLHRVIQVAFGWHDSHLHEFEVADYNYGIPHPDDEVSVKDERKVALATLFPSAKDTFTYTYDFGDDWEHVILIESITTGALSSATCLAGKRAGPPEDVGGVWGYASFLEAIADRKHSEHAEMLDWAGGQFDPEAFDLDAINKRLKKVK